MLILRLMLPTMFQASTLLIVALLAPKGAPVQMLFFGLAVLTLVMGGGICAHKIIKTHMVEQSNDALRHRLDRSRKKLLYAIATDLKIKHGMDANATLLYLDFNDPANPCLFEVPQHSKSKNMLDIYNSCMRKTVKKEKLSALEGYFLKKSMKSKIYWEIPPLSAHDTMASLRT